MRFFVGFCSLFLLISQTSAEPLPTAPQTGPQTAEKLPALGLDKNSISVSGISSGAFMAVQLGVAYSNLFKGVGAVAGGIYGCAEGKPETATQVCMKDPKDLKVQDFVNLVKSQFQKALIDDPANLAQQRVYIINGSEDKVVAPVAGKKLEEFYKSFGASPRTEFSLKMGHGFPTNKTKSKCEANQFPWLNNCNYDGAKALLETFYGPLKQASENKLSGELKTIDQTEFGSAAAKMLDYGHLYIPKECANKSAQCRLHIALHGCLQNPSLAKKAFVEEAGYNDWADKNKIVVLYPAATMGAGNPNGCWDWFGYTGENYAVKGAPQMTAIQSMIQRLVSN